MAYNRQYYTGFYYIYFKLLPSIYIYYILSYLKIYIKYCHSYQINQIK